jgi:hypothetical protein
MVHQLGAVKAGGGTAMGDALALAYLELQKTHVRDLAANGSDTRMNAIVLFTDGVPSSVVTYLNRNSNHVISSGSGCKYQTDTVTPTNPIYGYVVVTGSPPYSSQTTEAFYQLASLVSTESSTTWMGKPTDDYSSPPSTPIPTNCNSGGWSNQSNLSAIPSYDKYGWALTPNVTGGVNGYMFSSITGDASATSIYNGTAFSTSNATKAYQWGLAGWDEVDNVAQAIRSDSNYAARGESSPMPITIYTIGYTGNGGTDGGLLTKIANVAACSVNGYSCAISTQQQGLYAQASNATEISNAFNTILTAILRLAH